MAASGSKRVTIAEIAKEAGVSAATVSRVINNVDHPIDEKTRKRVEEVIRRKKYTINIFGKGLAGKPNIIGISVSVPLSSDPGFSQNIARILDGIKSVTSSENYHSLLEIAEIHRKNRDGTIFAGVPLAGVLYIAPRENDPVVTALKQGTVPFVLIGNSENRDCNFVDADNEMAGRMAVRHLAALGRTRLAYFAGASDFAPSTSMGQGFRAEIEKQGLEYRPEWILSPPMNVEGGRLGALKVFARKERPDSIFAFTDFLAIGAMQAIRELGFDVPGDVSVVGYDDFAIASAVMPQLTTFRHPDIEMSAAATQALLDMIKNQRMASAEKFQELFEPKLIVRGSCGAGGK